MNPYAKYRPDGTIEMLDIDLAFDFQLRETAGLIHNLDPLEVSVGGEIRRVDVAYATDYQVGDEVAVIVGRSQTTVDGQYTEVDLLPEDKAE